MKLNFRHLQKLKLINFFYKEAYIVSLDIKYFIEKLAHKDATKTFYLDLFYDLDAALEKVKKDLDFDYIDEDHYFLRFNSSIFTFSSCPIPYDMILEDIRDDDKRLQERLERTRKNFNACLIGLRGSSRDLRNIREEEAPKVDVVLSRGSDYFDTNANYLRLYSKLLLCREAYERQELKLKFIDDHFSRTLNAHASFKETISLAPRYRKGNDDLLNKFVSNAFVKVEKDFDDLQSTEVAQLSILKDNYFKALFDENNECFRLAQKRFLFEYTLKGYLRGQPFE
jgi:hypothetical protein